MTTRGTIIRRSRPAGACRKKAPPGATLWRGHCSLNSQQMGYFSACLEAAGTSDCTELTEIWRSPPLLMESHGLKAAKEMAMSVSLHYPREQTALWVSPGLSNADSLSPHSFWPCLLIPLLPPSFFISFFFLLSLPFSFPCFVTLFLPPSLLWLWHVIVMGPWVYIICKMKA